MYFYLGGDPITELAVRNCFKVIEVTERRLCEELRGYFSNLFVW